MGDQGLQWKSHFSQCINLSKTRGNCKAQKNGEKELEHGRATWVWENFISFHKSPRRSPAESSPALVPLQCWWSSFPRKDPWKTSSCPPCAAAMRPAWTPDHNIWGPGQVTGSSMCYTAGDQLEWAAESSWAAPLSRGCKQGDQWQTCTVSWFKL